MRRKVVLSGGLILTLMYSLMFLASLFLLVFSLIYFFVPSDVQIVGDILTPIISPFLAYGKSSLLIIIAAITIVVLFSLVCSSRFIKYSNLKTSKFSKKRGFYIFYLIWFVLITVACAYFLITNIVNYQFTDNLIINIILIVTLSLNTISLIILIFDIPKRIEQDEPSQDEAPQNDGFITEITQDENVNTNANEQLQQQKQDVNWNDYVYDNDETEVVNTIPVQKRPPIYTAGLDGEDDEETPENSTQKKSESGNKKYRPLPESNVTKQVISGISKLDAMRKSGKISSTQYTKLRNKLIKKLTKNI